MRIRQGNKIILAVVFGLSLFLMGLMVQAADTLPPVSMRSNIANGGWSSLDAMPAPTWDGKTLLFHSEQGTLAITPLSDDVFRVRLAQAQSFGRDHSYAVISHDLGMANVKASGGLISTVLQTATLKLTIQHDPLRISFANIPR